MLGHYLNGNRLPHNGQRHLQLELRQWLTGFSHGPGQPAYHLLYLLPSQQPEPLNRLTSISYPDGGLTTYSCGGTICSAPSSTTILISGSLNYTETNNLDGLCNITRKTYPTGGPMSGGLPTCMES